MIVKSAYQRHGVALVVDQLGWDALTNVTLFKNREIIAEFHPLIESEFENPCVDKESVSLGFPGIVHNGTGQEDVVASNTGRQSAHFILVSRRHGKYNPSNVSQRYAHLLLKS